MYEQVGEWPQLEEHRVSGPKVLLVVGGGIAAYKSCELVRLIRRGGGDVTCVLTEGGSQFVTPMALSALSENKVSAARPTWWSSVRRLPTFSPRWRRASPTIWRRR
jgi:phosphopantothenoylcysteine synthetase/decarboxylase